MTRDIVEAVKAKEAGRVQELLNENPSLVDIETDEGSLVLTAAYHGAWDVVDLLLQRVPQLDIFEAAAVGDAASLARILDREPGLVDGYNQHGYTPLGLAAFFGREEAVQVLIDRGADIDNVMDNVNANAALDAAVAANQLAVVKLLLARGAEVNVRAARGYSPLHKAAFAGNVEMLALLLEHGADVAQETDEGRTALDIADERGFEQAAEVLREHGSQS